MYFVISCADRPGQPELRQANRGDHLDYLQGYADSILAAGPTFSADDVPNGSVLIMDFEDQAAAEAFAAGDPYNQAGVFESVSIKAWKRVFPKE